VKLAKPANRNAFGLKIGQGQQPIYTKTYVHSQTITALLRKFQLDCRQSKNTIPSQQHVTDETITRNTTEREAKDITTPRHGMACVFWRHAPAWLRILFLVELQAAKLMEITPS